MPTSSGKIDATSVFNQLQRMQEALVQLEGMSVKVELDRARTDFAASMAIALGGDDTEEQRPKNKETDTITVNKVYSTLGPFEPWGHATISINSGPTVGLEPDSIPKAFFGLIEDLAGGDSPHFVRGHIERDYRVAQDHAVIHVTTRQASEAKMFIKLAKEHQQVYDFLYLNCAEWVEEVLHAAVIDVPSERTPGDLVSFLKQKYGSE